MSTTIQHILVSYDIHDPGRLVRVGKIMKDYGKRVLKSVFECNLADEEFERMRARLNRVIDHVEDSIRFYVICGKCLAGIEFSGLGSAFAQVPPDALIL